jgi:uncharacterized pyridoxamine 5'-phosphate oxidase family protein
MDEVYEFLKKVGTYYIATIDGDQPRVRAFATIDLFDGRLHIQTGKIKDVSKQIAANPKAEICAFDGEQWLRVTATLVEDPRIEAQQHMLDSYPELADMYQPGDGNNQVLYLSDVTACFATFGGEPKTVTF